MPRLCRDASHRAQSCGPGRGGALSPKADQSGDIEGMGSRNRAPGTQTRPQHRLVSNAAEIGGRLHACYGPRRPSTPTWPGPREAAGTSGNASSRPRARPASITTRCGPGAPGTPTSPCRCSPGPGCPPPAPWRQKGNRHQRPGHDRLHASGDPPPAGQNQPAAPTRPRACLVMVTMAPKTPVPGPHLPLPATRLRPDIVAGALVPPPPAAPLA
jgi:hypothetical protein